MKRKFSLPSIELPKFINSLRLDGDSSRAARDPFAQEPGSRPPTPKSVRPALPRDLNSELVAACTWIVTHPKPSHERWTSDSSVKPALDLAVIKQRYVQPRTEKLQRSQSARSMNSINALLPGPKVGRRPGKTSAPNEARPGDGRVVIDMQLAQSRADQLMQSKPAPNDASLHIPRRDSSHTHVRSVSDAPCPGLVINMDPTERQKLMARSDSSCTARTGRTGRTSGSSPHTHSTGYPRSASTGMTSLMSTPARSKSASSGAVNAAVEIGSVPGSDAINGELLRQEFERHRKAAAAKDTDREASDNALCRATYIPSGDIYYADELALERMQPQPRRRRSRSPSIPRIRTTGSAESNQQSHSGADQGRTESRFRSRFRSESKSDIRSGRRSASRAGSVASEMRSRFDRLPDSGKQFASRASSAARSVKRYLRPSNSMASMTSRDDAGRNEPLDDRATSSSHRSIQSPDRQPEEHREGRWAGLRRVASRSRSRRSNDDRWKRALDSDLELAGKSELMNTRPVKPVVDLNRELPPLPSLNQWTDAEDHPVEIVSQPRTTDASESARRSKPYQRQNLDITLSLRDSSSGLPSDYVHLHPLRRGLPQIPPMVNNSRGDDVSNDKTGPVVPVHARKTVWASGTIHAPTQSITSGTMAQSARATGRRQPSHTLAATNILGPDTSHAQPLYMRRTQSRRDMHIVTNDSTHGHARTRSDVTKSPYKYGFDEFKRKIHPPHKSELDLTRQQKSTRVDSGGQQTHKSGWKSWASKLKPRTTASHADLLSVMNHRRHESSDSSAAAASPVIHY